MLKLLFLLFLVSFAGAAGAEQVDTLVSVPLAKGLEQRGVLTVVKGDSPSALVLLFPGDPGVLKAEVADGVLVNSRLKGNPFVRARGLLVRPGLATLLIDCRSDQEEHCDEGYIMSKERFDDTNKLLDQVKSRLPGVKKVWIAGHSLGTLSSSSLARYGAGVFDGAIHASTILGGRVYTALHGFDYSVAKIPQIFISQRDDPCLGTRLGLVESAASRYKIPLVVITESSGARGAPCGAFSQHGFIGAEPQLMDAIAKAVGN